MGLNGRTNMIEVEIKAKVKSFQKIKAILTRKGAKLIESVKQLDIIFGHPKFLDSENKVIEGGLIARIRQENNQKVLEFKEISRKKGGIELKFEIGDIKTIEDFLNKLDFKEAFTVEKIRETYSYKEFTICLDTVKGLGKFIEIEKIVRSPKQKEATRKGCLQLLGEIAIGCQEEKRKYGDLIQDRINRAKRHKGRK